jgi:hypothetical protein
MKIYLLKLNFNKIINIIIFSLHKLFLKTILDILF